MHIVYLLQSEAEEGRRFVGVTDDLLSAMESHNLGRNSQTAAWTPWKVVSFSAFVEFERASQFERYLASEEGQAFAEERLWPIGAGETA